VDRDRNGPSSADVAIVGGGITGLAAAHRLYELAREHGHELRVAVLERSARAGGPILTEHAGEATIEAGPDQFVTFKPAALELCRRLGLEHDLVRFDLARTPLQVVHRGRIVPLPAGLDLAGASRLLPLVGSPLFSWRGKALLALGQRRSPSRTETDESVAGYIERRFGREFHERVVEPIVGGIFMADTRRLSADVALPRRRPRSHAERSGSRAAGIEGKQVGGFATVRGGMGRLVERLCSRLPAGSVLHHAAVDRIRRDAAGSGWMLQLADGRVLTAPAVVFAVPAPVSAAVLRPLDAELAGRLDRIDYASCATVNLLYPRAAVAGTLRGYGFFVPAASRLALVAASYVSLKFPERAPADRMLFRVFLGGARHPETLGFDDAGLARLAHRSLAGLLDVRAEPELARVWRFPGAMPQYAVGFTKDARATAEAFARHPGLSLAGSAAGAFGIPDCVASGERAAEAAWGATVAHAVVATHPSTRGMASDRRRMLRPTAS
jgi:oxygen-dependent protoporphyrinogen oxidase